MPQTINTRQPSKTDCCGKPQDCCPVCGGLTCLDRPRFFAGQLLTEAELNSEQAYVLAKNRLHNRYLHGYGIVCGLLVGYHICPGWTTIFPGYALDPCGNDILVCAPYDFDLLKAINDCCDKRRPADCDPWRQTVTQDCQNIDGDWLITIRYKEKEGQPTTALVSCSPSTCGCERGNGGGLPVQRPNTGRTSRSANLGACEPSRIIESFEICVAPIPSQGQEPQDRLNRLRDLAESYLPQGATDQSTEFQASVARFQAFATRRENLQKRLRGNVPGQRQSLARDLSRLREDLRDELSAQPRTGGDLLNRLAQVYIPPASEREGNQDQFHGQAATALNEISTILVQNLWGSFATNLHLCPPDVCDDRLPLARVTIKGKQIGQIDNSVRTYVVTPYYPVAWGSPTWVGLSLQQPEELDLGHITDANAFTNAAFAHMAAPPMQVEENMIETSPLVGRPLEEVRARLEQAVHRLETVRVQWNVEEAWQRSRVTPVIAPGPESVRVYVDEKDNVIGFDRESESQHLRRELNEANERMNRLESRLEELSQGKGSAKRNKGKG